MTIRVLVVAPTPLMRAGLRTMLSAPGIEVVGEVASPEEVGADLRGVDVLVVEGYAALEDALGALTGPAIGGAAATPEGTQPALVVLSEGLELPPALPVRVLPLRGWAIVPPDAGPEELQTAVQAAAQGMAAMPASLAGQVLASGVSAARTQAAGIEEQAALTARELEVLQLLSQGLPNKQIARLLSISEHTVKFHISSIYARLGVSNRAEAVSRGIRAGLISV
jgi:DNA-binding NarL/FixJ family response regulator